MKRWGAQVWRAGRRLNVPALRLGQLDARHVPARVAAPGWTFVCIEKASARTLDAPSTGLPGALARGNGREAFPLSREWAFGVASFEASARSGLAGKSGRLTRGMAKHPRVEDQIFPAASQSRFLGSYI